MTLGTTDVVENSQCRIRAEDSSVVGDGTHVTLKLMVELKNGLLGNRVFYVSAQDGVTTSGWHAVGSWTVP